MDHGRLAAHPRRGLPKPLHPSGRCLKRISGEENNWFAQFLDARCEVDPSLSSAGDLYQGTEGVGAIHQRVGSAMVDFNATLEQSGFERRKSKHGMYVYGLALTSEFNN